MAITIALHTGLRKSEILRLKWVNLDFINRLIIIEKTKGGDPHVVPMTETIFNLLTRAKQENKTELVFPSFTRPGKGTRAIRVMGDIKRAFASARAKAAKEYPALKDMTFHNLRRVCATTLYNNGTPIAAIQTLLHHKSEGITNIYLQIMPESLREASDILE